MAGIQKINIKAALKARLKGQSYREIATTQGVTHPSVIAALKPLLTSIPGHEHLKEYSDNQADIMDAIAIRTVQSISTEDLTKASLQQKATTIAIMTDKARLIRGLSNVNHAHLHLLQGFSPSIAIENLAVTDDEI